MIIVRIHGGLGNQMFQYALGRNLSLLHNTPFKIDSSYLRKENQSKRSFRLDNFSAVLDEATEKDIKKYRSDFQKILDKIRLEGRKKKVLEKSIVFDPDVLKRTDGYFDGHWNNEKYFIENEKTIRKDFTLKNHFGAEAQNTAEKIASEKNAVSLHIRRGDYISIYKVAQSFVNLPFSYYEEAMKKILEKYPDAHFFVSSDDILWVKENFPKNYAVTFVSSPDIFNPEISDCEELILMSSCKHNIMANSTFSWWAAWLNPNSGKMVIAPKKWYKDEKLNSKNEMPKSWIKI